MASGGKVLRADAAAAARFTTSLTSTSAPRARVCSLSEGPVSPVNTNTRPRVSMRKA